MVSDIAAILKSANCNCKEKTVFDYMRELQRVDIWPLEDSFKTTSMAGILEGLSDFNGSSIGTRNTSTVSGAEGATGADTGPQKSVCCRWCSQDWSKVVHNAEMRTDLHFDGLCLDCMDHTKNIRLKGDEDDDYWRHGWDRRKYDQKCRVSHGEPTWYFSFMGRREKRGQFD